MIGVEQDEAARKSVTRSMNKGKVASFQLKRIEDLVVGDAADGKDAMRFGSASMRAEEMGGRLRTSSGVGLFCGGTQRTALAIMQSTS